MRRSLWGIVGVLVGIFACAAPGANAYRKPTDTERTQLTSAWHHKHPDWRKQRLQIQEIRMSTVNRHYALVIFAQGAQGSFGLSKTDYFHRHRRHKMAAQAGSLKRDGLDPWEWIKEKLVPKDVKKEENPTYTVTYSTKSYEKVTTKFQDTCGNHVYTSTGQFGWRAQWTGVKLTLPEFRAKQEDADNFISGKYNFSTCPGRHANCSSNIKTKDKTAELTYVNFNTGPDLYLGSPSWAFSSSSSGCATFSPQGSQPNTEVGTQLPLAAIKAAGAAIYRQPIDSSNLLNNDTNCSPNKSNPCHRTTKLDAEIAYVKES
jgi:hypothetical protein